LFDFACVVSAEKKQQIERGKKKGLEREEILERMNCQIPLEEKIKKVDFVVKNKGDKKGLRKQAKEVFLLVSIA